MSSKPYIKLFVSDFLGDTSHLSCDEIGAFFLLLCQCWTKGFIPKDDQRLARITRLTMDEWLSMKSVIMEFFKPHKEGYYNSRATKELNEINDKKVKAKHSADMRWNKEGNSNVYAIASEEEMRTHYERNAIPDPIFHSPDPIVQKPESIGQKPEDYIPPSKNPDLLEIFNFWKDKMQLNRSTITDKRKKRIIDRLKKYSADDLKIAIEGCAGDNWHMDNKVNDIEYILRNDENVEKFIELYHNPKLVITKGMARQRDSIQAVREFVGDVE